MINSVISDYFWNFYWHYHEGVRTRKLWIWVESVSEISVQLNLISAIRFMWYLIVDYGFIGKVQERKSATTRKED